MQHYLPDVSVIITCFNYGRFLERCLRSLYNQNYCDSFKYEVIVIDDCSTDETPVICNKFAKFDGFVYHRNMKNTGLQRACNHGIHLAAGRYIVRVDADDYTSRHFLFFLKYTLDKSRRFQAVACDYAEVDEFENINRFVDCNKEEIACAVMYRREFLLDVGLYNEGYEYREGHELSRRFREKYSIGYLPVPLYFARKHKNNRSKNLEAINKYDAILQDHVSGKWIDRPAAFDTESGG